MASPSRNGGDSEDARRDERRRRERLLLVASFVEAWIADDGEALAAGAVEEARLWDPVGDWRHVGATSGGSAPAGRRPSLALRQPVFDVLVDGGDVVVAEGRGLRGGGEETALTAVLRMRGGLVAEARLYFDPGNIPAVDDEQARAVPGRAGERETRA